MRLTSPKSDRVCARTPKTRHILEVFAAATVAEIEEGLSWYADAHAVATHLDPEDPARAAGVLAALSPRTNWGRNVNLAARAYADGAASRTMRMCVEAADRILAGADPLEVLAGPKVRAFYACIADPGCPEVVVDRHAFDVAVGRVTNDTTRNALARVGVYERFAHHYTLAADRLDLLPSQVQSVTWLAWRRLKGRGVTNEAVSSTFPQGVPFMQ